MSKKLFENEEFQKTMIDVIRRLSSFALEMQATNNEQLCSIACQEIDRIRDRFIIQQEYSFEKYENGFRAHDRKYEQALDRLEAWPEGRAAIYRDPWKRYEKKDGELVCVEIQEDGSERIFPAIFGLSDEDRKADDWTFCFDVDVNKPID